MNVFVFLCCGAYDLVIPVLPRYDKPVRAEKAHTVYPSSSSEGISVIMKKITYLICFAGLIMQSCKQDTSTDNPFFSQFNTPFEVPPFDKIRDHHYLPAFREGMKKHCAEITAIINNSATPDFQNTVEALEKSGQMLNQVSAVFFNLQQANTNDSLNAIAEIITPELTAHSDAIFLNEKLFERIKTIYQNKEKIHLTTEQEMVLQKYYDDFVRGGANLSPENKERDGL